MEMDRAYTSERNRQHCKSGHPLDTRGKAERGQPKKNFAADRRRGGNLEVGPVWGRMERIFLLPYALRGDTGIKLRQTAV